ncbi:hypothetical protein D9M71_111080 [compost metagenome]
MFAGQRLDQAGLVGEVAAFGTECLDGMGHQRANGIERADLTRGVGAHLAVRGFGPGAQFTHVSEHQNGPPGKAGEYINGRAD